MSSTGDDSVQKVAADDTAATRRLMDVGAAFMLVVLALGGICGTGRSNVSA
jgi:hypothetical protein